VYDFLFDRCLLYKNTYMFADSIERVAGFTRPVHTIIRTYGGKQIVPGSATLFFVNENGVAITW
jgi:hypothetical protein